MQVTMTIYRRGVNWKRMPRNGRFLAWTIAGQAVLRYDDFLAGYRVPGNEELWAAEDVFAWAEIPQLETKP